MKYTPGPWRLSSKGPNIIPAETRDDSSATPIVSDLNAMWRPEGVALANLRLIAAAPEMASLLEKMRRWHDLESGHFHDNFGDDLKFVLAKARGES
jgi:hypothetical protein